MAYTLRVVPKRKYRVLRAAQSVKAASKLKTIESWLTSSILTDHISGDFPHATLEGLDSISSDETHFKGAILFVEGQGPRGVFVIRNGRVKLSAASADGRSLILRIAEAGEFVGLASTILGKPHEATAKALDPVHASFLPRKEFLGFLREHGDAALRVAEILSHSYHATYQEVRTSVCRVLRLRSWGGLRRRSEHSAVGDAHGVSPVRLRWRRAAGRWGCGLSLLADFSQPVTPGD
jgi:CRP-like cAMP-binding protein